jgi:hypothetical protein
MMAVELVDMAFVGGNNGCVKSLRLGKVTKYSGFRRLPTKPFSSGERHPGCVGTPGSPGT